jgi:hypothetical protein
MLPEYGVPGLRLTFVAHGGVGNGAAVVLQLGERGG